MYYLFFSIGCLFFFINTKSFAQCTPSPAASGACSGGNGAATNNANINAGQTFWFTGGPSIFGNVNVSGGTLRVCGTLRINNMTFNSGNIIIESGGSLTFENNVTMNNNTHISNYGTLIFNNNVLLQNSNNFLINATSSAQLTVNGTLTIQNNATNSRFINNGNATIATLTVQNNNGGVCLGTNSSLNITNLNHSLANGFTGLSGGCLRFTGNANLSVSLTNDSDVTVCRATGATTSGAGNFGSATVVSNCNACSVSLPVRLLYLRGSFEDKVVNLSWATVSEVNADYFEVQRSIDNINFQTISPRISAQGTSQSLQTYQWQDNAPLKTINYYRLIQTDKDFSQQIFFAIAIPYIDNSITFVSEPFRNYFKINYQNLDQLKAIQVYNTLGKLVYQTESIESSLNDVQELTIPFLSEGLYLCKIVQSRKTEVFKFIKLYH